MASRWRKWDSGFAVDVLNNINVQASEVPVKSFLFMGRGKASVNPYDISIPEVESVVTKSATPTTGGVATCARRPKSVGRGRGRVSREALLLASHRIEERLNQPGKINDLSEKASELDWPSLTTSKKPELFVNRIDRNCEEKSEVKCLTDSQDSKICQLDGTTPNAEGITEMNSVTDINNRSDSELEELDLTSLKNLSDSENYIIVNGVADTGVTELEELVSTFGEVRTLRMFKQNQVLISMSDELQCEWIISCLDGTELSCSTTPISVLRVCDVIEVS